MSEVSSDTSASWQGACGSVCGFAGAFFGAAAGAVGAQHLNSSLDQCVNGDWSGSTRSHDAKKTSGHHCLWFGGSVAASLLPIKMPRGGRAAPDPVNPGASLDTCAVICAIEGGGAGAVDTALAGRTPVVSPAAATEFGVRGDLDALKAFLESRGGRIGVDGDPAIAQQLQQLAAEQGRALSAGDANVVAAALREGTPLITSDKRLINTLRSLGVAVEAL